MLPVLTADYYSITIVNIQRKSYTNEKAVVLYLRQLFAFHIYHFIFLYIS